MRNFRILLFAAAAMGGTQAKAAGGTYECTLIRYFSNVAGDAEVGNGTFDPAGRANLVLKVGMVQGVVEATQGPDGTKGVALSIANDGDYQLFLTKTETFEPVKHLLTGTWLHTDWGNVQVTLNCSLGGQQ